ncbi:MAG: hypothetical protein ACPGR2_05220 [Psychrobium sp.]
MNSKLLILTVVVVLFGTSLSVKAETNCKAAEYRQFDFWLGKWQVTNSQNTNVSRSNITSINDGCGILEEYTTATGYQGKSLNIYDATMQQWHQTWIDNSGTLLQLDGKFEQGKMTLSGLTYNADGKEALNKIIWTPNADGTVRQQWMVSNDNGKTWQQVFDGMYRKALAK